jgi:tRNA pseudouridine55 synthase
MVSGFLLVDKPSGWTSHDVVAEVRRLVGRKKVGHGGTLDPMATGLLVLGLGQATRLLRFVQQLPKEYLARAVLGVATDTLDAEGAVLWREPMQVGEEDLAGVLPRFVGRIVQVPPMVSALRMEGRRLYELARQGEEVNREGRPVEVHELDLIEFAPGEYPEATLRVVCGKGTYVRALADDIGKALGGRAHLAELRRTRVGSFSAEGDGRSIESIREQAEAGSLERLILSPAEGLRDLPAVTVDDATARGVSHGVVFAPTAFGDGSSDEPFRVLSADGRLLAVYRGGGRMLAPEVVLA